MEKTIIAYNIKTKEITEYSSIYQLRKVLNMPYKVSGWQLNCLQLGNPMTYYNFIVVSKKGTYKDKLIKFLKKKNRQVLSKTFKDIEAEIRKDQFKILTLNSDYTINSEFYGGVTEFSKKFKININTAKAFLARFPLKKEGYTQGKSKHGKSISKLIYCYERDY